MPKINLPDWLLDHEKIRRLSMQSLFENLDSICEGTVIVDRDARIIWINERYATRLGAISAANAIGRAIEEVIPRSLMRDVVTSGQPILIDLLETPGATFVVSRIPLKDEHGVVIGAAGFAFFDQVQSLKPLFAKLENMQRELATAQKRLAEERRPKYTFSNFIGTSPVCMEVKRQARRAAQLDATFANDCVVPVGQCRDKLMRMSCLCSPNQLCIGRFGRKIQQVLTNCLVKQ